MAALGIDNNISLSKRTPVQHCPTIKQFRYVGRQFTRQVRSRSPSCMLDQRLSNIDLWLIFTSLAGFQLCPCLQYSVESTTNPSRDSKPLDVFSLSNLQVRTGLPRWQEGRLAVFEKCREARCSFTLASRQTVLARIGFGITHLNIGTTSMIHYSSHLPQHLPSPPAR